MKKKVNRFVSIICALTIILRLLVLYPNFRISTAIDTSYKSWKQSDSRWGSMTIDGENMAGYGCLVTSMAMLMVHSGAEPKDVNLFNPGILLKRLINLNCFRHDGFYLSEIPMSNKSPNFYPIINDNYGYAPYGHDVMYTETLNYLNQGYYVMLGVNYNGHWVAVDCCSNGEIYIMDPGSSDKKTLHDYGDTIYGLKVFKANNIYNDAITPSKPTLTTTPGTSTKATTFTWSKSTNADWYDVRIWFPNVNDPLIYWQCSGTSLSVNLPEGQSYWANVAPVNGEHLTYTFSDNIYFDVGLGTCEPTAITQYNGHLYALYDNLTNYGQAQELCKNMGGHLATITSAEENKVVASLIDNSEREYWLGANDVALEDTWVWDTGEPFTYENWNKDDKYTEPNNYDGVEHYMTLYKNGKWNDARYGAHIYDNGNGFILEIDPQTPAVIKEYNNHVYYRFDTSMNWKEAKAYCEILGGHLVTISDQKENDFVADLVNDGEKNLYWIGLEDIDKDKKFKWITAESFDYDNWADKQPDCYLNGEFYGEIYKDSGKWNDNANYFGSEEGFVCEIEKSVTSISVKSKPNKLTYYLGEKLDLTGLSLLAKHQVGDDAVVTSGFSADADMNTLGEQKVTVTYAGKSTSFTVNVICPKPVVKPQSKTDTTLNVTWTNIPVASEYAVILNGTEVANVTDTEYYFTNLKPATDYEVQVLAFAYKEGGGQRLLVEQSDTITVTTANKVTFEGEGKENNPYLISDYDDLKCLSDMVNDELTNPHFKNSYYKQTADIDMKSQEFIPIGNGVKNNIVFAGNYNGNYHKITNLKVTGDSDYSGLFGKVGEALNENTSCQISNLIVNGNVNSESKYSGGIAGMLSYDSTIYSSAFYGDVSTTGTAGGIVGYIENGGIIDACYHNGSIDAQNAGGVIGEIKTDAQNKYNVYVVSSYHHNGKVSGTDRGGGVVAIFSSDSKTASLYNNYYAKESANGGIDGTDVEGAKAVNNVVLSSLSETLGVPYSNNSDSSLNEGAPVFKWELPIYEFEGQGTEESPYLIKNKQELLILAEYLNDYTMNGMFKDKVYMQAANINLSEVEWLPIASNQAVAFSGIYDGGCHKITNLNVVNNSMGGFFGCVSGGTIKNLVVENGKITSEYGEAGGIVAQLNNNATIQNCGYIGTVSAQCSGGIVGIINKGGNIISCYQNGEINGETYAGGIVGKSLSDGTLLQNCYHGEGIVNGENSGGLIGNIEKEVNIVNGYYLKDISDGAVNNDKYNGATAINETVLSALGTTLEMPFVDSSGKNLNYGYPLFSWQIEISDEKISGDANSDGVVDLKDVVVIRRFVAGGWDVKIESSCADVNKDEVVDLKDVILIRRYIAGGWDVEL